MTDTKMNRALVTTSFILLSAGLAACAGTPCSGEGLEERQYTVRLVFFDFHGERVRLSINGTLVVDRTLEPPVEHLTGLNEILQTTLVEVNLVVLSWGERKVRTTIHADSGTRIVYVTPHNAPNIWASNSDIVQLD